MRIVDFDYKNPGTIVMRIQKMLVSDKNAGRFWKDGSKDTDEMSQRVLVRNLEGFCGDFWNISDENARRILRKILVYTDDSAIIIMFVV